MGLPAARLDHLVVAAATLAQGTAFLGQTVGVEPSGGGKHAGMGTHNRLLKLGHRCYLEVIAIDPEAPRPDFPRWFNLDDPRLQARLERRPRLLAWVARTSAIERLTENLRAPLAVRSMQRDRFRWRFAFTVDGALPGGGVIPHLIQWDGRHHPAEAMPESGCRLLTLEGMHPDPPAMRRILATLGLADTITVRSVSSTRLPGLAARIGTPGGQSVLLD